MSAKTLSLKELNSAISPDINPLMEGTIITSKERRVAAGMRAELIDPYTGEIYWRNAGNIEHS